MSPGEGSTPGPVGAERSDRDVAEPNLAESAAADEEEDSPSAPDDPGPGDAGDPDADAPSAATLSIDPDQSSEEAVAEAVDLAQRLERERDEYLDHLRRLKADFENYKRRVSGEQVEQRSLGALALVKELLPVLDALDAAVEHGSEEVAPLRNQFRQTLEKQGLEVVADEGVPFDPNVHEAVMHEDGEGEATVAEVLRTGYLWNGRVARAAMVRVRG